MLEHPVVEDEGAESADEQIDEQPVEEPRKPVGCLREAHHHHGLPDTCLLLGHYPSCHSENRREKCKQRHKRQELGEHLLQKGVRIE